MTRLIVVKQPPTQQSSRRDGSSSSNERDVAERGLATAHARLAPRDAREAGSEHESGAMSSGFSNSPPQRRSPANDRSATRDNDILAAATRRSTRPAMTSASSTQQAARGMVLGKREGQTGMMMAAAGSASGSGSSTLRTGWEMERTGYNSPEELGYNSGDEYEEDARREKLKQVDELKEKKFEEKLWKERGLIVRKCKEDGNCLFRAISDQLYGDQGMHEQVREHCLNYIAQEKDHFGQFITEEFDQYVTRKRRDKVHGNNLEMQAISELYNRPIEVFSYSTDPMTILQENSNAPPIRLSYHRGNHYNSVVNPKEHTIGVGLGIPDHNVERDEDFAQAVKNSEAHDLEAALIESTLKASMAVWEDDQIQHELDQLCLEQSLMPSRYQDDELNASFDACQGGQAAAGGRRS